MDLLLFPGDVFIQDKAWEKKLRCDISSALREAEAQIEERNESIRNIMSNIPPIGVAAKIPNQSNEMEMEEAEQDSNSEASTQEDQFDADLSSNNSVWEIYRSF